MTRHIEDKTGLVVERITKGADSSVSIYDTEGLCAVTAYALSHAGIEEKSERTEPAVRYFGEMANFAPTPGVEESMWVVAPTVMGIEMLEPPERCDEKREIKATETAAVQQETPRGSPPPEQSSEVELAEIASPGSGSAPAPGGSGGSSGGGSGPLLPERETDRENVELTRERECRGAVAADGVRAAVSARSGVVRGGGRERIRGGVSGVVDAGGR